MIKEWMLVDEENTLQVTSGDVRYPDITWTNNYYFSVNAALCLCDECGRPFISLSTPYGSENTEHCEQCVREQIEISNNSIVRYDCICSHTGQSRVDRFRTPISCEECRRIIWYDQLDILGTAREEPTDFSETVNEYGEVVSEPYVMSPNLRAAIGPEPRFGWLLEKDDSWLQRCIVRFYNWITRKTKIEDMELERAYMEIPPMTTSNQFTSRPYEITMDCPRCGLPRHFMIRVNESGGRQGLQRLHFECDRCGFQDDFTVFLAVIREDEKEKEPEEDQTQTLPKISERVESFELKHLSEESVKIILDGIKDDGTYEFEEKKLFRILGDIFWEGFDYHEKQKGDNNE